MKWKDSSGKDPVSEEPVEDYLDEEAYSPWEKGSLGGLFSKWSLKPAVVYGLAVFWIIVLVVALGSLFTRSGDFSGRREI